MPKVQVTLGGDLYCFTNGDWYGVSRGASSEFSAFFPGKNIRAPLHIYPELREAALNQGYDSSVFQRKASTVDENTDEVSKPRKKASRKKANRKEIMIF